MLSVESSAQLNTDGRREPLILTQEQHPTLTARDFENSDAIYLVYKVTNSGRGSTNLLGAKLRIGRDTEIKQDDPGVRSLCSSQGGSKVDCRQAFTPDPPGLASGRTYYFYFPLKDIRDKLLKSDKLKGSANRTLESNTELQGEIEATGLGTPAKFPLGISVNLQQ